MIAFKNSLAYRTFNFALKIEKISKDIIKAKEVEELEEFAKLQATIEDGLNNLFQKTSEVEKILKKKENK